MSSNKVQVYRKDQIAAGIVQSKLETQYPSDWFTTNPGKPKVFIKRTSMTTKELGASIVGGLKVGNINRDAAKIYLHRMAKSTKSTLISSWTTYGVEIGKLGDEISVSDLYNVEEGDECKDIKVSTLEYEEYDLTLFLLFIHRASRFNENTQITTFTDGLKRQFHSKSGELIANVSKIAVFSSWQTDREYNKIVAAFDMFFFNFSDHEDAALRYGSITTRYRDCASLLSVGHISKVLGVEANEVPLWVFNRVAAGEFLSLFKSSDFNESIDQKSYFPYQADFGFVRKSSYSSVATPSLFYLLHAVGCFMRDMRSINARLNTGYNLDTLTKNALIIASTFKSSTDLEYMFTTDGQEITVPTSEEEGLQDDDDGPASRYSEEVFTFMALRKFVPTKMLCWLNTRKK